VSYLDDLRKKILEAPYGSKEKDLYKFLLGEIQQKDAKGRFTEDDFYRLVKATINNNVDNVIPLLKEDDPKRQSYISENEILGKLLPKFLTREEIQQFLIDQNLLEKVLNSEKDTKAIGLVMASFKSLKMPVDGHLVREIIEELRKK